VGAAAGEPADIPVVAFGRDFFSIQPRTAALVVVAMQHSFVAEGARFSTADARSIVPNVDRLVEAARERRSRSSGRSPITARLAAGSCSSGAPRSG
jgi:hypothetical protein